MLAQPEIKPVYIRKPLQLFLESLESAYKTAFPCKEGRQSSSDLSLFSLQAPLRAPGTLNFLSAPPRLSIPLFLTLVLDHAENNKNEASLFVSKVPPEELVIRMTAYYSRIGINRLRRGHLTAADWPRVVRISSTVFESNIFFFQDAVQRKSRLVRELLLNHSERAEPIRLILLNEFIDTKEYGSNLLKEELIELRAIAEEFKVSIVVSSDMAVFDEGNHQQFLTEYLDMHMSIRSSAAAYEILIRCSKRDYTGKISAIIIPEIGVMEDR